MESENKKCKQCVSFEKLITGPGKKYTGVFECPGYATAERPSCFIKKQKRGKN
jgi:hypothetical protein